MIRFINLGDQIYCDGEHKSFAFYDTISCMWIDFGGIGYWDSYDEFMWDCRREEVDQGVVNRLDSLIPDEFKELLDDVDIPEDMPQ